MYTAAGGALGPSAEQTGVEGAPLPLASASEASAAAAPGGAACRFLSGVSSPCGEGKLDGSGRQRRSGPQNTGRAMAYAHSATERYRLHIDHHQLAIGFAPAKAACDRRPRGWKGAPEGLVHCSATRRQAKMLTLEELVQPNHYRTTTLRAAAHSSGSTSATCATFSYLLASPFTSFARLGVLLLAFSFHHGCSVHVASEVFSNYLHDTGCRFHEDVLELDCPRRQRPKAYRAQ
eukprot:scaffold22551_cov29-Tisochrysis_lutea.AAC.3